MLDGQQVAGVQSLSQLIEDVYRCNRYVRKLIVNGVERSVDDAVVLSLDETWVVELETCTLDELIEDTVASTAGMIPPLYQRLRAAVDAFRVGNIAEGCTRFAESVPSLQWNHAVLNQLAQLQPDGRSFVHEVSAEGERIVAELMEAWENEDYVTIADAIEYELLPWLAKWKAGVDLFQSQMKLEHMKDSFGGSRGLQ